MSFRELVGNLKTTVTANYVGKDGTLLVDTATRQVFVHDGLTPGGASIGGSSVLLTARVALTSAQIIASSVTPVPLVGSPGIGKAIMLVQAVYSYKFGTVGYTNTNSAGGYIYYGSLSGAIIDTSNVSQYADNNVFAAGASAATISLNNGQSVTSNAPIVYGGGSYTAGNGSGSITVIYYIVNL